MNAGAAVELAARATVRPVWRWAFVAVALAHLAALYWPRVDLQAPVSGSDKVMHLILFAAPTVAGLFAGVRPAYVIAVLAAHAPVSELLQHFVLPNRSGDLADAVADLVGVGVGVLLVVVKSALRR